jgi:hypothetical protein
LSYASFLPKRLNLISFLNDHSPSHIKL